MTSKIKGSEKKKKSGQDVKVCSPRSVPSLLGREEEKYRYLFEESPAVSFVISLNGTMLDVNRAILEATGYNKADLIGKPAMDFVLPARGEAVGVSLEKSLRGEWTPEMEVPVVAKDGSVRTLLIAAGHAYIYDRGVPAGVLMTGLDITGYKRVEEKLRNAAKMEALVGLSGSIAHDFNNLLMVILNYAKILSMDPKVTPESREMLEEIFEAARKGEGLSRKLLLFGRQKILDETLLNLGELLARIARKMAPALRGGIVLEVSAAPELWSVRADAGLIEEIIMNLVINSAEATTGRGTITVEASNIEVDETLPVSADVGIGRFVRITVTDEGEGMSEEMIRLAFEPFFTTRPKKTHSGLGLSIVYGAVMQCRGNVTIASPPGQGMTVRILLPAAP